MSTVTFQTLSLSGSLVPIVELKVFSAPRGLCAVIEIMTKETSEYYEIFNSTVMYVRVSDPIGTPSSRTLP